jgi:hypothetical protein
MKKAFRDEIKLVAEIQELKYFKNGNYFLDQADEYCYADFKKKKI